MAMDIGVPVQKIQKHQQHGHLAQATMELEETVAWEVIQATVEWAQVLESAPEIPEWAPTQEWALEPTMVWESALAMQAWVSILEIQAWAPILAWASIQAILEWESVQATLEWASVQATLEWASVQATMEWVSVQATLEWESVQATVEWVSIPEMLVWGPAQVFG